MSTRNRRRRKLRAVSSTSINPYTFFNPKAGLNYQLSERSTAYASYSIGNREPNRDDFTESTTQIRPEPEMLRDLEAGFRTQGTRLAFSANYYFMDYKNQLVLTGQVNDVGNSIRVNVPKSYRMGMELEGGIALNRSWKWNANATFSQNKIANFTEYVVDYDNGGYQEIQHGKIGYFVFAQCDRGKSVDLHPAKNVELALLTKYVGQAVPRQYIQCRPNPRCLPDQRYPLHLDAHTPLGEANQRHRAFQQYPERNLLLQWLHLRIHRGGRIQENFYYPQAGRNFLVGLNLKF